MAAHVEEAVGKEVVILQSKIKEFVLQKRFTGLALQLPSSNWLCTAFQPNMFVGMALLGML